MTIADWLMISAVFLGPMAAVQVQKIIEWKREKKNRRLYIFRALMTTRGNPISAVHVEALNMIDIEFYGNDKNDKKVVETWRAYLNHLCSGPNDITDPNYQSAFSVWSSKNNDFLVDLLCEMSKCLKHIFDKVALRRDIYVPKGLADYEFEQNVLRRGLADVFLSGKPIPITIQGLSPPSQSTADSNTERRLPHAQRN